MQIQKLTESNFRRYGRVIEEYDFTDVLDVLKETPLPHDEVIYCPSAVELEELKVVHEIERVFYGEIPMQAGYCNGNNLYLNGLEYHRSNEINIAATDAILLLGCVADISKAYTYDTQLVQAFFIPSGTAVELFATTLHYAPCSVGDSGFQMGIFLPKGTNLPLETYHKSNGEEALLVAKNKWLLAHPEGNCGERCRVGLRGENLCVTNML